jgi:WD40 repeat protein
MISGSYDQTSRQWDLQAGMELEEVRDTCDDEIFVVAVSRDGRWVITITRNYVEDSAQLKACEVETGIVKILDKDRVGDLLYIHYMLDNQTGGATSRVDISADNTLLSLTNSTARTWNLDTGKSVAGPLSTGASRVSAVRFSQDSKKLAVSMFGDCLEVWDVKTWKLDRRVGKWTGDGGSPCPTPMFWTNKGTILAVFRPP